MVWNCDFLIGKAGQEAVKRGQKRKLGKESTFGVRVVSCRLAGFVLGDVEV